MFRQPLLRLLRFLLRFRFSPHLEFVADEVVGWNSGTCQCPINTETREPRLGCRDSGRRIRVLATAVLIWLCLFWSRTVRSVSEGWKLADCVAPSTRHPDVASVEGHTLGIHPSHRIGADHRARAG